jgi:hypothetical protein
MGEIAACVCGWKNNNGGLSLVLAKMNHYGVVFTSSGPTNALPLCLRRRGIA